MSRASRFISTPRLSRRTLLRGAGGAALALPLLEIMGRPSTSLANSIPGYTAAGDPKRFIVVFTPNGTIREAWSPPTGGVDDWSFSRILQPLDAFREKLLIVDRVDQQGTGGDGHQNGMQGMLTGQTLNSGPFEGGSGDTAGWANGPSVDQYIASKIGDETPFRSLELSVQSGNNEDNWNRMCLKGPDQPVPPEQSPYKAYDRIFGGFDQSPDEAKLAQDRDRVVLNAVMENFRELNKKVGAEDRARLEQHLDAVSEIEGRLGKTRSSSLDACEAPMLGGEQDVGKNDNFPAVGRLQMDLLVMALACGLTRVGSLQWNRSVGNTKFNWLVPGISGHHTMSHDGDSNADSVEKLTKINVWYYEQLAYLLGKLDAIPEGDGTMLDNTVVFVCNELERGNSHSRNNAHYVIAGGAQYFNMGRYIRFDDADVVRHNNLLLSLVQSMGIEDTSFGKADWCSGPLPGLV